jgi:uncharacterized protein (TIGR02001 family)
MTKSRIALAGALLAVAGAAHADFSVTPTITSDYDFRGFTQTGKDPAFQLSANYTNPTGFYAGIWGSNVDFGPGKPNVELDYSAGFTGGDAKDSVGFDVGAVYYTYVNAGSLNYLEIYGGITHGWFGAKLWYSPDFGGSSTAGNTSAEYLEANGTFPLPMDFSALAHIGYSFGDYWSPGGKYIDWSVGVAKSFGNFATTLKYIDGSDFSDAHTPGHIFESRPKVVFAISTTLPWKSE